jgi:CBS domain-containing protein
MRVGELCSRNVVAVSAAAPLIEAARLMCEQCVGAVIVTAAPAGRPVAVGVVTDRDIVCAQLERVVDLAQLRLADVMTRDPLVLNEDDAAEEAIHRMRGRGVRRAPVISSSGALTGVISFDDLLAYVSANVAALAHLADRQHDRAIAQGLARGS